MPENAAPPFLDRLADSTRVALVAAGRDRRYRSGAPIFFEGDAAHDVFVVRSGAVKVSATIGGREVILDVLERGDVLGELAAIDGLERSANATTLTASNVLVIRAEVFLRFLDEHPAASIELLRSVTSRLRDTTRRQVEYGALDGLGRVCRRLVELMERFGRPDGSGAVLIEGPLSQAEIAAWAGLSREAVVKALQQARRLGWIETPKRAILVLDVAAVRARAAVALARDE